MIFLVLHVKQPKIQLIDVIEGKTLLFSVFEATPSRLSCKSGKNMIITVISLSRHNIDKVRLNKNINENQKIMCVCVCIYIYIYIYI